ncbi:MAG: hypothetical protein M1143_03230 [Candidatus Thermoplasmatota archaeon]|nr:hypothetical protein [Candidatus Thermoplasmatota archaeon]
MVDRNSVPEDQVAQVMARRGPSTPWRFGEIRDQLARELEGRITRGNAEFRVAKGLRNLKRDGKVIKTGKGRQSKWFLTSEWDWFYFHLRVLGQVAKAMNDGVAKNRSFDPEVFPGAEGQPVLVHLVRNRDFSVRSNENGADELWHEVIRRLCTNPGLVEPFLFRIVAWVLTHYPGDTFLVAYPASIREGTLSREDWPSGRRVRIPDWKRLIPPRPA